MFEIIHFSPAVCHSMNWAEWMGVYERFSIIDSINLLTSVVAHVSNICLHWIAITCKRQRQAENAIDVYHVAIAMTPVKLNFWHDERAV